jgi:DNA-binding MarR family transcriptional regulator
MRKNSRRVSSAHTHAAADAFRRIVRELRLSAARTQAASGISAAQIFVLARVAEIPESSVSELAEVTLTDRTSVKAALTNLSAKGLIVAGPCRSDKRKIVATITRAGRAVLRKAPRTPGEMLLNALRGLSDRDLKQLATSLHRLEKEMKISAAPAPMLFSDAPQSRKSSRRSRPMR